MKRKTITFISSGFFILTILFCGYVAYSIYLTKSVNQVIATNVSISSDWTVITPEPPLKVTRQTQSVNLVLMNYEHNYEDRQIKLLDGTIINPEVQIVDEYENIYDLKFSGWGGNAVRYSSDTESKLPKDRKYIKVNIRSDKAFECSKILWHNMNLK